METDISIFNANSNRWDSEVLLHSVLSFFKSLFCTQRLKYPLNVLHYYISHKVSCYFSEDNSPVVNETKPQTTSTTLRPTSTAPPRPTTPRPFVPRPTTRRLYTNKPTTTSTTRKPEPVTPEIPPGAIPIDVDAAHGPRDPFVVEKEKDPQGSVAINTADIPKDAWTNVIGVDRNPENRTENRPEYPAEIPHRPNTRPDSISNRPDNRPNSPDNHSNKPDRPNNRHHRPQYRPDNRSERPDNRPNGPDYKPQRPDRKPETPDRKPENKPEKPNSSQDDNIDLNQLLHCINGYEENEKGDCVGKSEKNWCSNIF